MQYHTVMGEWAYSNQCLCFSGALNTLSQDVFAVVYRATHSHYIHAGKNYSFNSKIWLCIAQRPVPGFEVGVLGGIWRMGGDWRLENTILRGQFWSILALLQRVFSAQNIWFVRIVDSGCHMLFFEWKRLLTDLILIPLCILTSQLPRHMLFFEWKRLLTDLILIPLCILTSPL